MYARKKNSFYEFMLGNYFLFILGKNIKKYIVKN